MTHDSDALPARDLSDLLRQTLPQVRCFVNRRLSARLAARESVSDVVQSACREVLIDLDGRSITSTALRKHLMTAARRKLADRGRRHAALRRDADREQRFDEAAPVAADDHAPDHAAVLRDDIARVERALLDLPETERDLIMLSVVLGLSHRDVARHFQCTEAAARSRLSRVLARLAARL